MPWPVHPNGLLGAQGDNDTYQISRSLRFNSADSSYLNRTPASASNRKTWTWSAWVKRGKIDSSGTQYQLFTVNNANNDTGTTEIYISLDTLSFGAFTVNWRRTTQVFRDPSAWYHLVFSIDTTQATAANRIRIYVNGSEITSFSTSNNPTQNADLGINSNTAHYIGSEVYGGPTGYFDGYLTEINFIDGQALTPSSFGETDAVTGRWKAKAYSGSYGTNGFYLKFADNSSTATLGTDSSGNGNTWTVNNFSVTAGAGNDSLVDSPTNYGSDSGVGGTVRGNYCTLNPLSVIGGSFVQGNLRYTGPSDWRRANSTISVSTGKWYYEVTLGNAPSSPRNSGSYYNAFGFGVATSFNSSTGPGSITDGVVLGDSGYYKNFSGSNTDGGTAFSSGDVLSIAVDLDGNTYTFRRNNTQIATGTIGGTSGRELVPIIISYDGSFGVMDVNFGQRPFAYTAPSGFKALCTTNLSTPTIKKPSSYMDVVTYTGTGASNSISSLGFSPDLVWIKNRGGATSHALYDTTRLATKQLSSDTTGDEATSSTGLTAFGSNGFTIGTSTLVNTSGTQYVAWAWDESPQDGLDIVSYTGNGSNRTISHNLGVAPKMLIVKARTTAGADQGWPVWHTSIANTTYLQLNSTSATATGADYWNSTSPTSSVFSVGTNAAVNANNDTYIAYCFAEIEGFSKFGSYTGNGSADGPFVYCGFRPRWVLVKRYDGGAENWILNDSARDTYNVTTKGLRPDSSLQEFSEGGIDFVSNGFKIRTSLSDVNASGASMIFAAFAEQPFKYARAR